MDQQPKEQKPFGVGFEVKPGSGMERTVRLLIGEQAWREGGGWDNRVYWTRNARGVWVVAEVRP